MNKHSATIKVDYLTLYKLHEKFFPKGNMFVFKFYTKEQINSSSIDDLENQKSILIEI